MAVSIQRTHSEGCGFKSDQGHPRLHITFPMIFLRQGISSFLWLFLETFSFSRFIVRHGISSSLSLDISSFQRFWTNYLGDIINTNAKSRIQNAYCTSMVAQGSTLRNELNFLSKKGCCPVQHSMCRPEVVAHCHSWRNICSE